MQSTPKIALVCDWLTTPGGAEKVLLALHQMYPNAPIYTSQYRPKKIDWFRGAIVKTGWLNIFPAFLRKFLGPLRQIYFSHLDLSDYDIVISVTGAEAKSVITNNPRSQSHAKHICYCHVPTQYYWQMYDRYLENPGFGFLNPLVRFFFKLMVKPLRQADFAAAQRPDQFVTISQYAAKQIKTYYHRDATIVHPPVDLGKFSTTFPQSEAQLSAPVEELFHNFSTTFPQYYVIWCRQVTWKKIDIAIRGCLKAKKPLLVIGDGPEHHRLVKLAGGSELICFLSWLSPAQIRTCLKGAQAYLFPSLEPFGIAAVEALAAGCPVIAYAEGGSRDIVVPGKNGLLFSAQTPNSLASALRKFEKQRFDRKVVAETANKFSIDKFEQRINKIIKSK